ncbi:MAG: hypothetical protein MHM6MM_000617 [Cercozoa sp. M6MM]
MAALQLLQNRVEALRLATTKVEAKAVEAQERARLILSARERHSQRSEQRIALREQKRRDLAKAHDRVKQRKHEIEAARNQAIARLPQYPLVVDLAPSALGGKLLVQATAEGIREQVETEIQGTNRHWDSLGIFSGQNVEPAVGRQNVSPFVKLKHESTVVHLTIMRSEASVLLGAGVIQTTGGRFLLPDRESRFVFVPGASVVSCDGREFPQARISPTLLPEYCSSLRVQTDAPSSLSLNTGEEFQIPLGLTGRVIVQDKQTLKTVVVGHLGFVTWTVNCDDAVEAAVLHVPISSLERDTSLDARYALLRMMGSAMCDVSVDSGVRLLLPGTSLWGLGREQFVLHSGTSAVRLRLSSSAMLTEQAMKLAPGVVAVTPRQCDLGHCLSTLSMDSKDALFNAEVFSQPAAHALPMPLHTNEVSRKVEPLWSEKEKAAPLPSTAIAATKSRVPLLIFIGVLLLVVVVYVRASLLKRRKKKLRHSYSILPTHSHFMF